MLRNLLDEVRSRRVLAFAALGVLVALALPLLFLKSAPEGAPEANMAAPAAAEEAKLPARAARLLATRDAGAPGGRATGSAQDPFNPPASYRAAVAAAAAKGAAPANGDAAPAASGQGSAAPATTGGSTPTKPIPVVIRTPRAGSPTTAGNSTPTAANDNRSTPVRSLTARNAAVSIRYGAEANTRIRRAIPRQKGFYIHGKLVAVFVKYSPSRNAAVFAVAPGLHISGPVKCRVKGGACRYIDIPAGAHAWLTTVTRTRTVVSRRLDVVHIKRRRAGSSAKVASAGARSEAACLARKLVAMERGHALLDRDACKN